MAKLHRLELVTENDEVLIFPGSMVKVLEIERPYPWEDPDNPDEVTTFERARICLAKEAAVRYPTACGVSSIDQLERVARFRDIMWIDVIYEGEEVESYFVPYEDAFPGTPGSPNRLMQAGWDENGDLWVFIGDDLIDK